MQNNPVPGFCVTVFDACGPIQIGWLFSSEDKPKDTLAFCLGGEEYYADVTQAYEFGDEEHIICVRFCWENPSERPQTPFNNEQWETIRERITAFCHNMPCYGLSWQEDDIGLPDNNLSVSLIANDEGDLPVRMGEGLRLLQNVAAFIVGYLDGLGVKWIAGD